MKKMNFYGCALALAALEIVSILPGRAQTPRQVGFFTSLAGAYGIAIDTSGNVSVDNFSGSSVLYYSPTGTFISMYNVSGFQPYLADSNSGELFLPMFSSNQVDVYNPATGTLLNTITGSLSNPASVTFGNGDIFVLNQLSSRTNVYNTGGTLLSSFASLGNEDITFGPDGNLYEASGSSNQIYVYSTTGTLIRTLTVAGAGPLQGLRFDGNRLLTTSIGTGDLYVLNSSGTLLGTATGLAAPSGIAIAPNGEAYVIGLSGAVYIFSFGTTFGTTPGLTPNQATIGGNIDGYSGSQAAGTFGDVVTALSNLPTSELSGALDQLSPQKFGQFTSKTAFNNASFETEAQDNYSDSQRKGPNGTFTGGNGNIDASGLTLNDPSYDPGLAMVHSRLLAWSPGPLNGTISDIANPMLGGIDMKDSKEMAPSIATNPWNVFVRGNVILAQGFSQQDVPHFDDNTESVVLGADYRFSPNFLVGLTVGYGHTDVTLDNDGSSATVDSYSPGLYASYADKGWYANVTGNYTHNAYTQDRVIGFLGQTANSAPEGNEGTANLDGGYDFHCGGLTYGPLAGVQYTHLTVDGYNESGSVADLSVNDQESDSLRSRLGGRISYSMTHCGMTFVPHLDASWQHEFLDQSRGITSQFSTAGLGSFSVRTENPSRDSALADAGLDAEINRAVTVFADYEVQAGQENYFGQSVQAGVKIGF